MLVTFWLHFQPSGLTLGYAGAASRIAPSRLEQGTGDVSITATKAIDDK